MVMGADCFVFRVWLGTTAPDIWDLSHLFLSAQFPLGGAVYTLHTALWQRWPASSYKSPVLMALLMHATVQGDREQWFWGLVWCSESRAVKCSALTASLAAPYTASDPLFSPIFAAWHQPVFCRGGCGISRWGAGNNHPSPSQLTGLLSRFPLGGRWREIGIRPPPKTATAAVQQGYLWSCPSESFASAHIHAHARIATLRQTV